MVSSGVSIVSSCETDITNFSWISSQMHLQKTNKQTNNNKQTNKQTNNKQTKQNKQKEQQTELMSTTT